MFVLTGTPGPRRGGLAMASLSSDRAGPVRRNVRRGEGMTVALDGGLSSTIRTIEVLRSRSAICPRARVKGSGSSRSIAASRL
ncbi:hypothetical protein THAOC_24248, partial [Thalassiosira oceanica]